MMDAENGWIEHNGVLIRTPCTARGEPKMNYYNRVAAFSFNNTIVKTKHGTKKPSNRYDIDWWCDLVLIKLSELNSEGYSLVVINDEVDVEKGNLTRDDCKHRFDWFATALYKKGIPVIGLFSLESNCLRKPYTTIWQILKTLCKGWQITLGESMYVGADGARIADKTKHLKADSGYKDRAFAINNGLIYYSPDELFRKHAPRDWRFPEDVLSGDDKKIFLQISSDMERSGPLAKYGNKFGNYVDSIVSEQKYENAIVLLVGQRSSGKSTIANQIVSEDSRFKLYTKGTQKIARFLKNMTMSIEMGGIPVIDGPTFASRKAREPFVEYAKEKHIPLIIISVITPYKLCLFYDRMKVARDFNVGPITMLQYKKFKADYQAPKSDISQNVYVIEWPLIINVEKEFWLTL
jgi:bifunctional polynucleotide phosphatase/kinase